jgi:hypothetical protein
MPEVKPATSCRVKTAMKKSGAIQLTAFPGSLRITIDLELVVP